MAGIFVTNIVPPETGWPVASHCSKCGTTEFILVPWGSKPHDGDYHIVEMCQHPRLAIHHNMPYGPYVSWDGGNYELPSN